MAPTSQNEAAREQDFTLRFGTTPVKGVKRQGSGGLKRTRTDGGRDHVLFLMATMRLSDSKGYIIRRGHRFDSTDHPLCLFCRAVCCREA